MTERAENKAGYPIEVPVVENQGRGARHLDIEVSDVFRSDPEIGAFCQRVETDG